MRNDTTKLLKNKEMNSEVYKTRREVIKLVYEAKKLVPNLPRITVRIAENHHRTNAVGRMGGNIIWVTERFAAKKRTVFHEICHAAFAQEHINGCPLMGPYFQEVESKKIDKLFIKYARKAGFWKWLEKN